MVLTINKKLIDFIINNYKSVTNRVIDDNDIVEILFGTTSIIIKLINDETFYVYYWEIINKNYGNTYN